MDKDLFEKGLSQREGTLGAEYVEKNLAVADDFTRPFQERCLNGAGASAGATKLLMQKPDQ